MANHVPVDGSERGDMHCQGDMEKADMVDGKILSSCLTEALG